MPRYTVANGNNTLLALGSVPSQLFRVSRPNPRPCIAASYIEKTHLESQGWTKVHTTSKRQSCLENQTPDSGNSQKPLAFPLTELFGMCPSANIFIISPWLSLLTGSTLNQIC